MQHAARRPSTDGTGTRTDVVVVGGGIAGLTAAWRALRAGLRVVVVDPEPAGGATHAAAGMLAPVSEAEHGEHALARVNLASAALWDGFARDLADASGVDVGLTATGTLTVAYDAADAQRCRDLLALQRSWGLDVREVTAAEARERLPLLGPHVAAATWAAGEQHVDPRAVARALLAVLAADARASLLRCAATGLLRDGRGAVVGVRTADAGEVRADVVVLAAGADSAALVRDVPEVRVPVRPVTGTTLRLDARRAPWFAGLPVLRGTVQHRPVYVVARPGGEVVVGATSDEAAPAGGTRAGDVFALLRDARALVPGLDELPLVDVTTRARPATRDHLPLLGASGVSGLVLATGHHRNGVLQAPLTAAVLDAVLICGASTGDDPPGHGGPARDAPGDGSAAHDPPTGDVLAAVHACDPRRLLPTLSPTSPTPTGGPR